MFIKLFKNIYLITKMKKSEKTKKILIKKN